MKGGRGEHEETHFGADIVKCIVNAARSTALHIGDRLCIFLEFVNKGI